MRKILIDFVPGLLGGLIGGAVGYFAFQWLLRYNLFAPVLPGALTGLGCGMLSRTDSKIRGVLCAVESLLIGLFAYWKLMIPMFETDGTFFDLVKKSPQLPPPTLLMLGLGVVLGFWWGKECTLRGRLIRETSADRD